MAIPDYQELMLPLLELVAKSPYVSIRDAVEELSNRFTLTDEERRQLLPSGSQRVISNRIGWAKTYLKQAGLLISPKRGIIALTEQGRKTLGTHPTFIDKRFLEQFDAFRDFVRRKTNNGTTSESLNHREQLDIESHDTPEEAMERIYQGYKDSILAELLEKILSCSFTFFEQLVVDLMLKLGYGGGHKDAGFTLGRTGDEGIDGMIKEDRLGLEVIYLQAKRWKSPNTIGRPEIQRFAGALLGKAGKGVFITTSNFSDEARRFAESTSHPKIILIDGRHLCELLWEKDLGLDDVGGYRLKRVKLDYFSET